MFDIYIHTESWLYTISLTGSCCHHLWLFSTSGFHNYCNFRHDKHHVRVAASSFLAVLLQIKLNVGFVFVKSAALVCFEEDHCSGVWMWKRISVKADDYANVNELHFAPCKSAELSAAELHRKQTDLYYDHKYWLCAALFACAIDYKIISHWEHGRWNQVKWL